MRGDYKALADLFWKDGAVTLTQRHKLKRLGISQADLHEERLRRLLTFCISLVKFAPASYVALCTWGGRNAIPRLMALAWNEIKRGRPGHKLVADTFDPYFLERAIRRFLDGPNSYTPTSLAVARAICALEFGRKRAQLVAMNREDPAPCIGLAPGATFILCAFDLEGVFAQFNRLVNASLPPEIVRQNVRPAGPHSLCAIEASNGEVAEYHFKLGAWRQRASTEVIREVAPDLAKRLFNRRGQSFSRGTLLPRHLCFTAP